MNPFESRGRRKNATDSLSEPRPSFLNPPLKNPIHLQHRQDNAQTSLSLNPAVIANGFTDDGQTPPVEGESRSLTSNNNFINFCALFNLPITNGIQLQGNASCNPIPMGALPSGDSMPSSKFRFPLNGDVLRADVTFTISMKISNLNTGIFTSGQVNFLSAPQQLDGEGKILGHSAVVIEQLNSFQQTDPPSPAVFAFFKGLSNPSQAGVVSADIQNGLTEGFYRISSINSAANHQPVLVSELAHGALDDVVYFTVTSDGKPTTATSLGIGGSTARSTDFILNTTSTGKISQQSLMTLDPAAIGNFTNDGGDEEGLVKSLTSTNNFINFCLNFPSLPMTNGKAGSNSSCNPAPMGLIAPVSSMPTIKFLSPRHLDNVPARSTFLIQLNVANMQTGVITNKDKTYLSAPQQLDSRGRILGHVHIVIEELTSLTQDEPTNPREFAFYAELGETGSSDSVFSDAVLEKNVTGLPDGVYRLSAITVAANHQPVLVSVAQRGSLNDMVYFTVGNGGDGSTSANTLGPDLATATATTGTVPPSGTNPGASEGSSGRTRNLGAAVGGAIAGVVVLILLLVGLFLFRRRRKRQGIREFRVDDAMIQSPSGLGAAGQISPFPIATTYTPSVSVSTSNASSSAALVSQAHHDPHVPPVPVLFPAGSEKKVNARRSQTQTQNLRSPQSESGTSSVGRSRSHYGSSSGMSSAGNGPGNQEQQTAGYASRHRDSDQVSLAPSYHTTA